MVNTRFKAIRNLFLALASAFILFFVLCQSRIIRYLPETHKSSFPTANDYQPNANTLVWADSGNLILFHESSLHFRFLNGLNCNYRKVIVLNSTGHRTLSIPKDDYTILGFGRGFVYYRDYDRESLNDLDFSARALDSGEESSILYVDFLRGRKAYAMRMTHTEDDQLMFHFDTDKDSTCTVMDGTIPIDQPCQEPVYVLGDYQYFVDHKTMTVYQINSDGKQEPIYDGKGYTQVELFPQKRGILLYARNQSRPLYWIDEQGQMIELIYINSLNYPTTTMNFSEESIYISVKSLSKIDTFFGKPVHVRGDPHSGTYRISTDDFSIEKVDDTIYSGIFVFGEGVLFACDEDGSVFQFDQNWNRTSVIYDRSWLLP